MAKNKKNETVIGSVIKAVEILFLFTEKYEMSLTEITEKLGMGKSSACKYLNTSNLGYVIMGMLT